MTVPVPKTNDELVSFCKYIAHKINSSGNGGVDVVIGTAKVITCKSFVRNTDDNEGLELVVECESLTGEDVTWVGNLSQLEVKEYGHGSSSYYFSSPTQESLLVYI